MNEGKLIRSKLLVEGNNDKRGYLMGHSCCKASITRTKCWNH